MNRARYNFFWIYILDLHNLHGGLQGSQFKPPFPSQNGEDFWEYVQQDESEVIIVMCILFINKFISSIS